MNSIPACMAARGGPGDAAVALLAAWLLISVPAAHPGDAAAAQRPGAQTDAAAWGTFLRPFAADSLWNSRPVAPEFGDFVIPKSGYHPRVGGGKYSLEVFLARAGDQPMAVAGLPGRKGIWDPDAEAFRTHVTIPRWPAVVTPAEGNDGHADIVDAVSGIVHSFYKLRYEEGEWRAAQYAWTRIDGRGWGDPAHYFQGARAAGVPSMGGLIRKHEVRDGDVMYRHALAVSLTFNALAASPAYVFPATSADTTARRNSGAIPEGALLMLPPSFDTGSIRSPELRKVAETLKVYGARVVDRNHGTPFNIYVENGVEFNLHRGGWNSIAAADLQRMREALRQVTATGGWLDGNGRRFTPDRNLNRLSMRGPWRLVSGTTPGTYDTWAQAVVFPASGERSVLVNASSRNLNPVAWAVPEPGSTYRLRAVTTGGGRLRLLLRERSHGRIIYDSRELADGETVTFAWPDLPVKAEVRAVSGTGVASSVRGTLIEVQD